ncbi:MAG: hypothetical protein JSS86_07320 [Cyanobacteria bacterium SZAS LIN-2]|nr:hypothetical protein [Cyanobacteria bacterium SZAS LIN-2]
MSLENHHHHHRRGADAPQSFDGTSFLPNVAELHRDLKPINFSQASATDSTGALQFSPIKGYDTKPAARVEAVAAAPAAPAETHDYIVKRNDNLWNIARESLTHGDRHVRVDGEQVWQRIREIVDASKAAHPEIRKNPFFITKGEHLVIPGAADAPAAPVPSGGSRRGHGSSTAAADSRHPERGDASASSAPIADGGHLAHAIKTEAHRQARKIDTVGDCARGPRQTLEQFGIKMRPMPAVAQGQLMEKSGLFDVVRPEDVQPGDYGYRHWSARTIRRRGLGDLGDSFIVTDCNKKGWQAANDHMFTVPPAGGYYRPGIVFLRPNAKFYAAYQHYKETGEKTHLS